MIHTSPLPEITVPDKLLTPYVLQRADHLADTPLWWRALPAAL